MFWGGNDASKEYPEITAISGAPYPQRRKPDSEPIQDNIYGGPILHGSIAEQMAGDPMGDPALKRQYLADVMRQGYGPGDSAMVVDPATGELVPQNLVQGGGSLLATLNAKKQLPRGE